MKGILTKLDEEVRASNVKVISDILSVDKSKAEGIVSALLTIMVNYHANEDKVVDEETEEPMEDESMMDGSGDMMGGSGGMKTSSSYKML